ncbi:JmjC domain-containing protein, partial [Microdochium bolleyi]
VPGVNSTYMHAGNRNSGTAFHCEDGVMRSVNLTLFGWNIWILVAIHHTDKLESFLLGKARPGTRCDQSVRHENIILSPNVLQAAEIDFIVLLAGPGDLVETQPRQYHWVINYSTVVKMAINF